MEITIVNIIQAMLAPGIMISACGLLLLGANNKYSLVINRIRILDEEIRKLRDMKLQGTINKEHESRLHNIELQTAMLVKRFLIIRNTLLSYLIAVAFFIITCLAIGLQFSAKSINLHNVVIMLFLAGMISVLVGIIYAVIEVIKGYRILQTETNEGK